MIEHGGLGTVVELDCYCLSEMSTGLALRVRFTEDTLRSLSLREMGRGSELTN